MKFGTGNWGARIRKFRSQQMGAEARAWEKGFTLLELLVALTITSLVVLSVVLAFSGWVRTQERADWVIEKTRTQEYALSKLREVISLSYVPFVPGRERLAIFEGKDLESAGEPFDALTFGSLGHRIHRINAKESELMDMKICTVPDPAIEKGDQCRKLRLLEGGALDEDKCETEGGVVYELVRNVSRFQLFYLSSEAELKQEWSLPDSDYQLPCAVIIWLGLGCEEAEEDFCLLIPLHLTNSDGCEFSEEDLKYICEIKKW